jgi:hypothetical protein
MRTTLPKTVPVLAAKHMHKGSNDGPNGTRCLRAWRSEFFHNDTLLRIDGKCQCSSCTAGRAIQEQCGGAINIATFNDDPRYSKSTLANAWNKAMASLGYIRKGSRFVLPAMKASAAR